MDTILSNDRERPIRPRRGTRSRLAILILSAGCLTGAALAATPPQPYEIATWSGFRDSAVSYTFDDNSPKQFSVAQPMFDERGLPATFFCIVGNLSDSRWAEIENAAANGHEIASHSMTHPDLSKLEDDEVDVELSDSKDLIEAHTGQKCVSHAYPFCAVPNESITSKYYHFARSCNGSLVPSSPTNFLRIGALGPDDGMIAPSDNAAATGSWLVWLLHGIDDDPACCPISSQLLEENLDYVAADPSKWWVETFGNVSRYIQERDASTLTVVADEASSITLRLTNDLDNTVFNYPLSLRRPMPSGWAAAAVTQDGAPVPSEIIDGNLVFDVVPNGGDIVITKQRDPATLAHIDADDPNIQYIGRFDMTDPAAPGFDWSYSTIRAKFQGAYCAVKLDGPNKYFDVFIDGSKIDPILSASSGLETFVLASDLSDADQSITLRRRAEANAGKNVFLGFVLDEGKALVEPDPAPSRKIAFIGDSYTCGYGVEAAFDSDFDHATENAGLTYAARMANHYKADGMFTSWSGKGMVRNYGDQNQTSPDPLPSVYGRTCGSVENNDYDFAWQPDVVVIALGINDFSTTPHPSQEQYAGGYGDFINTIRGHYPDAHIICTYLSSMDAVAADYIAAAVEASGDSKVHFANVRYNLEVPADFGTHYHPNIVGQTKIANAFIPVFDSIMGTTWGGMTNPGANPLDLIARYAFEGDALDTSDNGNDGAPNALSYVAGKSGAQAAQFDGSSSYVSIPSAVKDDFTVTLWVKTTDDGGSVGAQWSAGKGLVDGGADWGTALVDGRFALGIGSTESDTTLASSVTINDGAWHHLAATRDNATGAIAVYVDGVLRGSDIGPTGSRAIPATLRIGSLQTDANFLDGALDDLRLYDRVLTADEIAALVDTQPELAPIADKVVNVGQTVAFTASAANGDQLTRSLSYTLLSGPTNATLDPNSGAFSFRPLVTQANTTHSFTLELSDDATPPLAAAQTLSVTVNPIITPNIDDLSFGEDQFSLRVDGETGPDYRIETSTNLTDWAPVYTANSPTMPFTWTDAETVDSAQLFYRVKIGPPLDE